MRRRLLAALLGAVLLVSCGPSFAGSYGAKLPAASGPGRDLVLDLTPDGTARFSTDFNNGRTAISESGTWSAAGQRVTLTLTGQTGRTYDKPVVIVFDLAGGTLSAVT